MSFSVSRQIEKAINSSLPNLKKGTLRFWGKWFGQPYNNIHTIVGCESTEDTVKIRFEHEMLTIVNPKGFTISDLEFKIVYADKVVWEWLCYGRPKTSNILYKEEYVHMGNNVKVVSNADWYKPDLRPSIDDNAVELRLSGGATTTHP